MIALTVYSASVPSEALAADYLQQADSAYDGGDYATAMTCFERVVAAGESRPQYLFKMSLTAERLGDPARAAAILKDLTSGKAGGHPEAHLVLARRLLAARPIPEGRLDLAESHLRKAINGLDDPSFAKGLLGELLYHRGQLPEAEALLTARGVLKRSPQLRLRLAQIFEKKGDAARARSEARHVVDRSRSLALADAKNVKARLLWADSLAFLEEFEKARDVLQDGYRQSRARVYQLALSDLYRIWAAGLPEDGPLSERFTLWEKGLRHNPRNSFLIDRFTKLLSGEGEKAERVREVLRSLLTGEASSMAHFVLGLDEWQRGNRASAKTHWESAYREAGGVIPIANNLAYALAEGKNPDLGRALQIIDQAILRAPADPNLRDTRGRIYMKLSRWEDALGDLQISKNNNPDRPRVQQDLAQVYEELGNRAMAKAHKMKAERLAKSLKKR